MFGLGRTTSSLVLLFCLAMGVLIGLSRPSMMNSGSNLRHNKDVEQQKTTLKTISSAVKVAKKGNAEDNGEDGLWSPHSVQNAVYEIQQLDESYSYQFFAPHNLNKAMMDSNELDGGFSYILDV